MMCTPPALLSPRAQSGVEQHVDGPGGARGHGESDHRVPDWILASEAVGGCAPAWVLNSETMAYTSMVERRFTPLRFLGASIAEAGPEQPAHPL